MSSVPPNTPGYPPGTPVMQPVAAGQPVVVAPAAAPQQVVVQPAPTPGEAQKEAAHAEAHHKEPNEVIMFSHTNFFYWWPVWLVGYVMAVLSRIGPGATLIDIGGHQEWFNTSKDLGVIFTLTCFLVILITNVTVRGVSSLVVIMGIVLAVVLALYFQWWEQLATWFSLISIHMNMGFYVCFATATFIVWFLSVFIYDRRTYWKVTPGQITQEFVIGGAAKSFDTRGMVFEKHRNDLFRHWVLGLGSGDVVISTMGAKRETISVPNVLFVDSKVAAIQRLIAMQPDEFANAPT